MSRVDKTVHPWMKSKVELREKVIEILNKQHVNNKKILSSLLNENPWIVDEYIKTGESYGTAKDIVVSLYKTNAENWGVRGLSLKIVRNSARTVKSIMAKIGGISI